VRARIAATDAAASGVLAQYEQTVLLALEETENALVRFGHARNEEDEAGVKQFMKDNLPANAWSQNGFYERLYLYQSYAWYAFIRQDFLQYYRYTKKWVDLFRDEPIMIRVETGHYIKGIHNLLNAHFDLRNYSEFSKTLEIFEAFAKTDRVVQHDNFRIQAFLYITQAKINQHFMQGSFKQGLTLVPEIEEKLEVYKLFIDRHRVLVLTYKIAMLYFGSGDYDTCIDYLQKIINNNVDLRYDLQCYARLLHLLAHYELGNYELMEPLTKSVYRFMAKMENLNMVEEEIFRFLRKSLHMSSNMLEIEFKNLLFKLKQQQSNPYATRAFFYLDIISWLESKIDHVPVQQVIRKKFLERQKQLERPQTTDDRPHRTVDS